MEVIWRFVKGLILGAVGFGIGMLCFVGINNATDGLWEEGPVFFIYAPVYVLTVIGFIIGLCIGGEDEGCAGVGAFLLAIPIILVILAIVLFVIALCNTGDIWAVIVILAIIFGGGGYIMIRFWW